jgi:hypothetical protein
MQVYARDRVVISFAVAVDAADARIEAADYSGKLLVEVDLGMTKK